MAHGNIASSGIVLEVLTRDNYLNWSTLVKNYLIGKDLWDNIVVGDPLPADLEWKSKNGRALHAIQLSCGYQTLCQIRDCRTAKDAWNQLKTNFSDDLKADCDIEQGHAQDDEDLDRFHMAVKKGSILKVESIITNDPDIVSKKSKYRGWTSLHVAVDARQTDIMMILVKSKPSLLTEKDWEGYTPLAIAAESTGDKQMAEWMLEIGNETNHNSLNLEIRATDGKGDIPILLAAANGHKEMTRFLFSKTDWVVLDMDDFYYGAKLLSLCIHAEIFDVAAALLQHYDTIPLGYGSDQCGQPIRGLAHITNKFVSRYPLPIDKLLYQIGCRYPLQIDKLLYPSATKIYEITNNHYLVRKILKCVCKRVEKSFESELRQWSVYDAMLHAAKYGVTEFLELMIKANPNLVWAMDKYKRGVLAHAILNRQEDVLKLICELKNRKELVNSKDVFGNNLLHLAAELAPAPSRGPPSNPLLQMQKELYWFKAVEKIVPLMFRDAKNADGMKPRELFTKNHEQLVNDGRKWAKEIASSFIIVGTLIITITFAAAFTVPGGSNESNGSPIFLGKSAFSLFILTDALSLITSTSSVLMFIGILNSRYAEEDFIRSLPLKFLFGLFTNFLSVVFMMCSFCSALALMLKGYRWIVTTTILFAIIPILVFMVSLLRLLSEVCISFVNPYSFVRRNIYILVPKILNYSRGCKKALASSADIDDGN